jgi:hypothetical protein
MGVSNQGQAVPVRPSPSRFAFETPQSFTMDGGGISSADAFCQQHAVAAGLPGTYLALLATTSASAASRFSTDGGPWVRVDNAALMPTADAFLTITSGALQAALNLTPDGGSYGSGFGVWTGAVDPTQLATTTSCQDWTASNTANSSVIGADPFLHAWFHQNTVACTSFARLYCLQQ